VLNYFFRSAIDWVFRLRSLGYWLVRTGAMLLTVLVIGLTIGIRIPTSRGPIVFDWTTSGGTSEAISCTLAGVAILLITVGLGLIIRDAKREGR